MRPLEQGLFILYMAIYRQIQTTFWQDAFVLSLTPEEKYFYIYLMTNSKTKQCGIYELPLQIAQIETGYNRETVIKLIQKFIEFGKVAFDWETSEIALKNWMKYNPDNNPKIAKCVKKELCQVKNERLIEFIGYPIQGVSQQEEEQEQKEEEEQEQSDKVKFADSVYLSNDEYSKLVEKLTEPRAKKAIEILDNYKGSSGKKYKSDYKAILNWVINELEKREKFSNGTNFNGNRQNSAVARATYEKSPDQIQQDVRNTAESIRLLRRERG